MSDGRARTGTGRSHFRLGSGALVLGVVQFFVLHLVVQFAWPEPYSWAANNISDLGVTACGPWHGHGRYICSPLHTIMNASFVAQGVLLVAGIVLANPVLRGRVTGASHVLISLAGLGWVLAGVAPADVNEGLHVLGAFLVFFCGNLGLVFAEGRGRIEGARTVYAYSRVLGAVGLVAAALFLGQVYLVFGMGGMERIAVFPLQLWALLVGLATMRAGRQRTRPNRANKE